MKKLTQRKIIDILTNTEGNVSINLINNLTATAKSLLDFIIATSKTKTMIGKYMRHDSDHSKLKDYLKTTTNYDISFEVKFLEFEEDFEHIISSVSHNYVYVNKTKTIIDAKRLLKEIQAALYVLTFEEHKDLIEKIDEAVETTRSINHNDIIFESNFYNQKVIEIKNRIYLNYNQAA